MENLKPALATGLIAFLGVALIYAVSPDLTGLKEYRYAVLVPVFTSIVAVSSLYFIYRKLSEVIE
jgi:hypothetical protein